MRYDLIMCMIICIVFQSSLKASKKVEYDETEGHGIVHVRDSPKRISDHMTAEQYAEYAIIMNVKTTPSVTDDALYEAYLHRIHVLRDALPKGSIAHNSLRALHASGRWLLGMTRDMGTELAQELHELFESNRK